MKRIFQLTLALGLLFLVTGSLFSQKLDHVLGDVIIKINKDQDIQKLAERLEFFQHKKTDLKIIGLVSQPLNAWLLHFDQNTINEYQFLAYLQRLPQIQIAQFNHLIEMRQTVPDDPLFGQQWQYINDGSNGGVADADIDADLAWDITTGGLTPDGDTIVAAILDNGVQLNHEDFGDNLWINYAEIPNDGLDNDNNGYIDDYLGWATVSNDDNIAGGSHGTPVAGIVGAQGNNGVGVSGINWDVKLMIIKNNFQTNEAQVLAAYSYPLEMRRRYNQTNGAEGAFVVSTNASWGVDFGNPEDAPLWCAFYDTLGLSGIISCGATINGNQDVDVIGDLPTACPSDYLISVTNMNRSDIKVTNAGYGATTIDLGAFGEDAYNMSNGNSYSGFGGTSGATPLVTGAIALLYSAPCPNLIALAKTDPAAAALQVKDYILEGVDPNTSLQGITTTGGRLNIFNSLNLIVNNCSPCPAPFALGVFGVSDVQATLSWSAGVNASGSLLRWRETGTMDWDSIPDAVAPFVLTDLLACTEYEFQLEAICPDTTSGFTNSFTFKTDGCCIAPENITVTVVSNTMANVTWDPVLAADSYNLELSCPGGTFSILDVTSPQALELAACEECMVALSSVCNGDETAYSDPVSFMTQGCGPCTDLDYCESYGEDADFEWIESTEINGIVNNSGPDGGYGDYTGDPIDLMTYNAYDITLTPGFASITYDEYFKVWIDFNLNGTFEEPDELVFDAEMSSDEAVTGSILIPGSVTSGVITRMRIGMSWEGTGGDQQPEACQPYAAGETEDYCINILPGEPSGCDLPTLLDTVEVQVTAANISWVDGTDDHTDHNLRYRELSAADWIIFENVDPPYLIFDLKECTDYEVQVDANCTDGTTSGYTESLVFITDCPVSTKDLSGELAFQVFPNPFSEHLAVQFQLNKATEGTIRIYDSKGQIVKSVDSIALPSGENSLQINELAMLPAGIYFLQLHTLNGVAVQKVLKY